ncbi:hypothetical protein MAR_031131 [Mya arenaria]|uniref:Short-chain collagen C4 n=1 Tax=Mya arenaria TaxID=6604 RepID=A0ABY7F2X0_MYAAR|nr:uncharacterized protein LOC128205239 [Mya arenaria]WAR16537.1 hypothetical protein MAR_031131 [Mya arenaria]
MLIFSFCVCIFSVTLVSGSKLNNEPQCVSRFDFDYKVLTKFVELETETKRLQNIVTEQGNLIEDLKETSQELRIRVRDQERSVNALKSASGDYDDFRGASYVRWGRTSCPANGTSLVYEGFAGGSFYTHKGAAVNYLCLTKEPLWGNYKDAALAEGAYLYGGEYQFNSRNRNNFFGKEIHQHDAPCAVCETKRSTILMIPGRNKCLDGWTEEYHGYLVAGQFSHDAGSEYICLDAKPEVISDSVKSLDGKLFYLVEGRCGTLPCPPYVNNREITCVVCSK